MITIAQAKEDWKTYTRHVISDWVKKSIKKHGLTWDMYKNHPMCFTPDIRFYFYRNDCGYIYCSIIKPVQMSE